MKKYKCPVCLTTKYVIRYGYRNKVIRLLCNHCHKSFSLNPCFNNNKQILSDHLDGLSFRKLSHKYKISKSQAWDICNEELKKLPSNNQFTFNYCSRFSNIFMVDGKYFNVASNKYDYVLLWGIDYLRHDIPVFTLAPSENYQSWARLFSYFRIINHFPQLVVCDDNSNIKMAVRDKFPSCRIQTCYNHFKENIRKNLKIRSDKTYIPFMRRVEKIINSSVKLSDDNFNNWLFKLFTDYQYDPICISVLTNIEKYKAELLGYRGIPNAPLTTNLIEGLNSHLESRLLSLRSFQTLKHAKLWFNGYILKRRMTKFTDCRGKFSYLNGKTGVEMTKKHGVDIPSYFD